MCERGVSIKKWFGACLAAALVAAFGLVLAAGPVTAGHDSPQVRVWSDRGTGGIYHVGESAEVLFEPDRDCYVIIYEIDTDGYLRVLFPRECDDDGYVLGGRAYRVWRDGFYKSYVNGPTGVTYVHALASFEPFRRVYWDGCSGYERYAREATWAGFNDYWGCALPPRVYGDPYTAMQMIDEFICLDALEAGYVWADFTYYYVGERVHYPRYLCYDCHGFNPRFQPYSDVCVGFSISFVDCNPCYDPWSWWWWCSPKRTYCGPRYVCHDRRGGHDGHGSYGNWSDNRGRDDNGTYPSEYKWKSRGEGSGLNVPAVARAAITRGNRDNTRAGNSVDAVRVKSRETGQNRDASRDQALYSRSGSRSTSTEVRSQERAPSVRETVKRETPKRDAVKRDVENREVKVREAQARVTRERETQAREVQARQASERTGSEPEKASRETRVKSGGRSLLGSVVSSILKTGDKSGDNDSKNKPKGVNPEMRRGDKGKSRVARRTVSR